MYQMNERMFRNNRKSGSFSVNSYLRLSLSLFQQPYYCWNWCSLSQFGQWFCSRLFWRRFCHAPIAWGGYRNSRNYLFYTNSWKCKSPYNSTILNRALNSDPKQVATDLSSSRTQFIYSTINISILHLNSNTITTGTNSRQRVHILIPIVIILHCLNIHAIMTGIISRQCHISSVCQFKPSI